MNNVMVDLETTSTLPEYGAIIQIAAVRFDLKEFNVDDNFFDQCLGIPPYRFWSEDTRNWWMSQPPHVLQGIYTRMRDPRAVMEEFQAWCGRDAILWAKPTSFEFPFLSSYFHQNELSNPFDFRKATDIRSFLNGLYYPDTPPSDKDIPFEGDQHNALFDVLHQIKWLFESVKSCKGFVEILPPQGSQESHDDNEDRNQTSSMAG